MSKIKADYGIIKIDNDVALDLYLFNEKLDIESGQHNFQSELSDGRYVVGRARGDNFSKKIISSLWKIPHINLETMISFGFGEEIDDETVRKIKEELLTRKCIKCKKPTRYDLSFVRDTSSFGLSIDYSKNSCLWHLNEIIENEKREWEVHEHTNFLKFSKWENLGRVKYVLESEKFRKPLNFFF